MKDINKSIEDNVYDIEDMTDTDIKINPDYYIHKAILSAQKALLNDEIREGHLKYVIFVEHIEILAIAANMVTEDEISEMLKKPENKLSGNEKDFHTQIKKANFKLKFIMERLFQNKEVNNPLTTFKAGE